MWRCRIQIAVLLSHVLEKTFGARPMALTITWETITTDDMFSLQGLDSQTFIRKPQVQLVCLMHTFIFLNTYIYIYIYEYKYM